MGLTKGGIKTRLGAGTMYTYTHRIGFGDTEASGVLSPAAAARLAQDGAMFHMDSDGPLHTYMKEQGIACYLVAKQMQFRSMPAQGEEVRIETSICGCKNFYGLRNTIIYNEQGKACVICAETGAFVHHSSGRPVALPRQIQSEAVDSAPYPMDYEPRSIKLPRSIVFQEKERSSVLPMQLDRNQHLNSIRGLEMIMKHVTIPYRQLRGEYRSQAKLGEALIIDHAETAEGKHLLRLHNGEGKIFCIHEFRA